MLTVVTIKTRAIRRAQMYEQRTTTKASNSMEKDENFNHVVFTKFGIVEVEFSVTLI